MAGESSPEGALAGRVVVVTRRTEDASELQAALESQAAEVVLTPCIRHERRDLEAGAVAAVLEPKRFTHAAFTSKAAVECFAALLEQAAARDDSEQVIEDWHRCTIAAIGGTTARALAAAGFKVDCVPDPQVAAGGEVLARTLVASGTLGEDSRILLPQSRQARPELKDHLQRAGVAVEVAAIYDTVPEEPRQVAPFLERIAAGTPPDAITFFSPSAVTAFLGLTADAGRAALQSDATRIVSVGPTTSAAVRAQGLEITTEARRPGTQAVVEAVVKALPSPP